MCTKEGRNIGYETELKGDCRPLLSTRKRVCVDVVTVSGGTVREKTTEVVETVTPVTVTSLKG